MYSIKLTKQQIQIIFNSLVQMPFATVATLIAEIESQIRESEKQGKGVSSEDS